ncbi:hypothetical protein C0099_13145 [Pseudazoarcus pumilus]|uniref:Protein TonB n=2 Tax=Pseudazoarcus pumilus TaxID=2067960 RepID=A0A2I6SB68_9RHOO|nr:hypothetical protein C0099_13145 [Pseudazoarcus pumilus]
MPDLPPPPPKASPRPEPRKPTEPSRAQPALPPVAEAPPAPEPAARPPSQQGVTDARYDAAYLDNPPPAYPALSRRMREEGRVLLRVFVSAQGQAKNIEVEESSGSNRLDSAARNAVQRWRFVPAREGEREIDAWVLVPVVFKLEG